MTWEEVLQNARTRLGENCRACPVCDGRACKNKMPGPGAKGSGTVAIRNFDAWQRVFVNMDTICESRQADPSLSLFGRSFRYPFFAGPVGAVALHYGGAYDDLSFARALTKACASCGIAAFTGDGVDAAVMQSACEAIRDADGVGIPTVKPWDMETVFQKLELVKQSGAFAVAMDVDAAGLPFLQGRTPAAGPKTVEELSEIAGRAGVPFLVKGVMTVRGAQKALQAGASGIVVSNHGGRVLDGCPATAEVLPGIAKAVGGKMTILVDGGIRTGLDVFRALALGADAVILARPFVTAMYGGGEAGVSALTERLGAELRDTMQMCGVHTLSEITRECVSL